MTTVDNIYDGQGFLWRIGRRYAWKSITHMDWRLDALRNRQSIFVCGRARSSSAERLAESSTDYRVIKRAWRRSMRQTACFTDAF